MAKASSTEIKRLRSELSVYCGQFDLPSELRRLLSELDMNLKLAEHLASVDGDDASKFFLSEMLDMSSRLGLKSKKKE